MLRCKRGCDQASQPQPGVMGDAAKQLHLSEPDRRMMEHNAHITLSLSTDGL